MTITCPVGSCRAENEPDAVTCAGCGVPLQGYARLSLFPNHLFNMGLAAAKEGRISQARDLFAAVVNWCSLDALARNALAMACFAQKDYKEARKQWEAVLARTPEDPIATKGLVSIASATPAKKPSKPGSKSKKQQHHKKKRK